MIGSGWGTVRCSNADPQFQHCPTKQTTFFAIKISCKKYLKIVFILNNSVYVMKFKFFAKKIFLAFSFRAGESVLEHLTVLN